MTRTAVVVGGGIIGCAAALELIRRGFQTTIVEKEVLWGEASSAAAGMLGTHVETHFEGPLFDLSLASLGMYRTWSEELAVTSGLSPQYQDAGILRLALTEEDEEELRSRLPWIGPYEWLSAGEVRRLEPGITESVRGGLYFREDHQIHPVHLAASMKQALVRLGCTIMEHTKTLSLLTEHGRVAGIETPEGPIRADVTVLAAGAWSNQLLQSVGYTLPLMPVRGQCYDLVPDRPVISRTLFTKGGYLLPRMDGTITVGATMKEAGFNKKATIEELSAVHQIAVSLVPELAGAHLASTWAGLRPGTPDGLPYLGEIEGLPGLILSLGHYRNGILLAPISGRLVGELAEGIRPSLDTRAFAPGRALSVHA